MLNSIYDNYKDNITEDDFVKMWDYALDDKNYNFMVISAKDKAEKMYRKQFKSFIMIQDMKKDDKNYMINSKGINSKFNYEIII